MKTEVKQCCALWHDDGTYCRMTPTLEGWGCRLLGCLIDKTPKTELDRKKLFHKVYTHADDLGVLECPHFKESFIDEVIDDHQKMAEIVRVCGSTRTDLLSKEMNVIYN